ncbi:hypothetical protein Mapa_017495 [Marchantia paleacea]|nr:hypothetical protein Mapa_017495 [Marchantia paleacea]
MTWHFTARPGSSGRLETWTEIDEVSSYHCQSGLSTTYQLSLQCGHKIEEEVLESAGAFLSARSEGEEEAVGLLGGRGDREHQNRRGRSPGVPQQSIQVRLLHDHSRHLRSGTVVLAREQMLDGSVQIVLQPHDRQSHGRHHSSHVVSHVHDVDSRLDVPLTEAVSGLLSLHSFLLISGDESIDDVCLQHLTSFLHILQGKRIQLLLHEPAVDDLRQGNGDLLLGGLVRDLVGQRFHLIVSKPRAQLVHDELPPLGVLRSLALGLEGQEPLIVALVVKSRAREVPCAPERQLLGRLPMQVIHVRVVRDGHYVRSVRHQHHIDGYERQRQVDPKRFILPQHELLHHSHQRPHDSYRQRNYHSHFPLPLLLLLFFSSSSCSSFSFSCF